MPQNEYTVIPSIVKSKFVTRTSTTDQRNFWIVVVSVYHGLYGRNEVWLGVDETSYLFM